MELGDFALMGIKAEKIEDLMLKKKKKNGGVEAREED